MRMSTVEIKGTTIAMFQILIDHIYERAPGIANANFDTSKLFEIYNLGEMYDVGSLKQSAMNKIKTIKLTREYVVEVAFQAEQYRDFFQEVAEMLYHKCLHYLAKYVLKSRTDFIIFSND